MPMWGELSKPENSDTTVCQYRSVLAIYRKPKRYSLVGDHMKVNAEFDCLSPQNCVVLLWLTFYFLDAEQGIHLLLVKKIVVIWLLLLLGKWIDRRGIDKQALLKICLYSINLHHPEYLVSMVLLISNSVKFTMMIGIPPCSRSLPCAQLFSSQQSIWQSGNQIWRGL